MLNNKELLENIRNSLYFEFQLAIEMLSTVTEGIDRLIKFLVKKISAVGAKGSAFKNDDETLNHLMDQIHDDKAFQEEKALNLTCECYTHILGWKLDELVLHSPVLLVMQQTEKHKDIYFFKL